MGNFYTNITVKGPDNDQVLSYLSTTGRVAYLSPTVDGCTVVFDRETEEHELQVLENLAADISRRFDSAVLAVMNHDDDVLWCQLYERGLLIDKYNSAPGYLDDYGEPVGHDDEGGELPAPSGGDAGKLCAAFGVLEAVDQVESILRKSTNEDDTYLFAISRHLDLVNALGLPSCAVATGYMYIEQGEIPDDLAPSELRHTGP